jgi:osmotically-inducible protein OsmY
MAMQISTTNAATWALALALSGAACSDRADSRADDAARQTGDAAASAAREAGDAVANAGRAAEAAVQTIDVKTALMSDDRVDARDINVDTDHDTRTVVLKGFVLSASQKTIAEQIAAEQAKGYRIQNELVVR